MSKAAAKPGPVAPKAKVLYVESDNSVLTVASRLFERAGYMVDHAVGRATAEIALRKGNYDVVILGHTLTKDDRHHLPYMVKKINEDTQVLVLHASGKHPAVDIAIDSRYGEKAILSSLASLAELKLAVAG
jgi:DNA-binding NtrC family response regulator